MIRVPLLRLLAPLAVVSSTLAAQAPASVGLDTAGMDRDGQAGRRVLRIRQRLLAPAGPRSRPIGAPTGRARFSSSRPTARSPISSAIPRTPRRRPGPICGEGGRLLRRLPGHDRDRDGRPRAARPTLDSIAAISDRHGLARFLGSTLRADVDALNNTNFYTEQPVRPLGGAGPGRPHPLLAVPAPGRSRHARPELLSRLRAAHGARSAASTGRTSQRCCSSPAWPTPTPQAARILALETGIAAAHWSREQSRTSSKGNNHWARADFGTKAPGLDWEAFFAAAGLARPAAVRGLAAQRGHRDRRAGRERAARDLEGLPRLPRDRVAGRGAARPRSDEQSFAFYGPVLERRPAAARALEARGGGHQRRAGRRRRASSTSSATSRRRRRPRRRRWSPNIIAAFRDRIDAPGLDGARHQGGGQGQAGGAQGRRRLSRQVADYSGLEVMPRRRVRQRRAGRAVPVPRASWPSWASRWTGASG